MMSIPRVLIAMARLRHGDNITPVAYRKHLTDCITIENGIATLWYNDESNSTRVVTLKIGG